MTRLIGAELFKLRTTRTFYGLTGISIGLMFLLVGAISIFSTFHSGDKPLADLMSAGFLVQAITLVLGVLAITSEFRHGTITPSLLVEPNRARLVLAKLGASLLVGLALGLLVTLMIAGIVSLFGSIRGFDTGATGTDVINLIVGGTLAAGLYAALGVGIGALVRNQVGAIIGVLVWLFVLEGLIGLIPGLKDIVPKYGLNGVRAGLSGQENTGNDLLGQVPAGAILVGYVLVFGAAGIALMRKRDITA